MINPKINWSIIDDQILITGLNNTDGYLLNSTSKEIFLLLNQDFNLDDIQTILINKYGEVYSDKITADLRTLINDLSEAEVLI